MGLNRQLGAFLKARRHALDPVALGLPVARRRRTQGLRREEVAARAGISCEWYIKLEQGRDVSPSPATVAALARALSLDSVEAAHLRNLAAGRAHVFERETVPDIIGAIVTALPEPAYVTGARWDVLTWNGAADVLFGFSRMSEADRNILLFMLTDPGAPDLFAEDWAEHARRMVGLFRVDHDRHAGDPAFEDLVLRLTAGSAAFRDWWSSHAVGMPAAGTKTLQPTGRSRLRYAHATFQSNDNPALKLALYTRHS